MSRFVGFLKKKLTQKITYWEPNGRSGFGEQAFKTPVLLQGRWEDAEELKLTKNGELELIKAIVYVTDEINLNGYMALGDYTNQPDPYQVAGASEVKKIETNVSVDGKTYFRKVYL